MVADTSAQPAVARSIPDRRSWLVLVIASFAVFMSLLDTSIVNIAFPAMTRSFPGTSFAHLSWVLDGYTIVFAAVLIPGGRLADRFGRRRLFLLGCLIFSLASVGCAIAGTANVLIASRLLQGGAAALLGPSSLALVLPEFPSARRATAVTVWGSSGAVAVALGPSLGGVIIDLASWRWVFLINPLVSLPLILAGRRVLTESKDEHAAIPDILGGILLFIIIGGVVLAVVEGPSVGWKSGVVAAGLIPAVLALPFFLWRSIHHAAPIFEWSLFKIRSFAVADVGVFTASLGFYALLLCNVLFLTDVWRYPILKIGLALTPGAVMAFAAARPAGTLADRFGERVVAVAGAVLFTAGSVLYAVLIHDQPHYLADYLPATCLTGLGISVVFSVLSSAAVREVPAMRYATAAAITNCFRQLGAAFGIVVLVALTRTSSSAHLGTYHRIWLVVAAMAAATVVAAAALGRRRPGTG